MNVIKLCFIFLILLFLSGCSEKVTVEFRTNGGDLIESVNVESGTTVVEPNQPIKEGYSFIGWYSDSLLNNLYDFSQGVNGSLILYAGYEVNQYKIIVKDNQNNVLKENSFDFDSSLEGFELPNPPNISGFSFEGWNTTIPRKMPAMDIEIIAEYIVNQYSIRFFDGDTNVISEANYEYNDQIDNLEYPQEPFKEGHTFTGWDKTLPKRMPAENIDINALFSVNSYKIDYRESDGTKIEDQVVEYGERIIIEVDTRREGYTFVDWYIDETLETKFTYQTMPSEDLVLFAKWNINQYDIVFIDHIGEIIETISFDYNTDLSFLEVDEPSRIGYEFVGWDGEIPDVMPATDIEFQAIFDINEYEIIFYDYDDTIIDRKLYEYNAKTDGLIYPEISRPGYTFLYWEGDIPEFIGLSNIHVKAIYIHERKINGVDNSFTLFRNEFLVHNSFIFSYNSYFSDIDILSTSNSEYSNSIYFQETYDDYEIDYQKIVNDKYLAVVLSKYNNRIVKIYDLNDFELIRTIYISDGAIGMGHHIAIDGDYIYINAPNNDVRKGKVFIYKFSDSTYEKQLSILDGEQYDNFGAKIILNNNSLYVSAPGYNSRGAIFIYNTVDFSLERIIYEEKSMPLDFYAGDFSITDGYIYVSAKGLNDGAIYVYKTEDENFKVVLDDFSDVGVIDYIIYDDLLIVGATRYNNGQGAVHIYKIGEFNRIRVITASDGSESDLFGSKIRIYGDYIIISAPSRWQDYDNIGAVYIYKISDPSYERLIVADDENEVDGFGYDLVVQDNFIYVSSYKYNNGQGAVFVYNINDDDFSRKITSSKAEIGYKFGMSIMSDGEHLYVFSSEMDYFGTVYMYELFNEE